MRSHSTQAVLRPPNGNKSLNPSSNSNNLPQAKGRARSSSLVTVTEAGGDETENVVDRLGVGTNENAEWVNAPGKRVSSYGCRRSYLSGAWLIHPVLILLAKILIDAIPGMTQDVSWTIVNLGYMAVSTRRLQS